MWGGLISKKLSEIQVQIEISNSFAALENINDSENKQSLGKHYREYQNHR
jgi:hypothetical protein